MLEELKHSHERWMKRCLVLAQKAMNQTQPNPMVGCVIVNQEKLIHQGYHELYGQAHAEANALKNFSSEKHPQAILYVNLEPCAHQGKTGPCAQLIVEKKIKTVVYGCQDPNPKVAGQGLAFLKQHGVKVMGPILEEKCLLFNRAFFYAIGHHKPYVTAKFALSNNGYMGSLNKQEKISGLACQRRTMKLRALSKAIMVGVNTVNIDDPKLTIRGLNQALAIKIIVFDPGLNIKKDRQILEQPDNIVLIYDQNQHNLEKKAWLQKKGVQLYATNRDAKGGLNLQRFWQELYAQGVHRVLVEGGARLIEYLEAQDDINEYCIYQSKNKVLEGEGLIKGPKIKALQQRPCFVINSATDHIQWYKGHIRMS
ncbi:MAG TPA: bifunctional diaminohydroxyphosphoribosylaminopyrimidine deaminase/5-amino-6-(5-phosphoribosylamino)uracil reductase RibD [Oligoflexia bacterium]|nr:bifunctional diaminohydroxyphosphoribosylaminopyrimidine deaminase/5-amino-6-(5-phosphoribosylamino)uracil reductase RibD [Oligoflexia bacterium]HMR24327.1 bifunctional diaminohydroxyphosphoribosylaminopyrimidine deaminase/5-amino-6-(5-phosphoribosylamino)uracil reductase RibD [Oligoflexia bacterium]